MKFTFALLAVFVSAAAATPISMETRQNVCSALNTCPLQCYGPMSIIFPDSNLNTRWDLFGNPVGPVKHNDLGWFVKDKPTSNELFTAIVGAQPKLYTFQSQDGLDVGVSGGTSGAHFFAATSTATLNVTCSACNAIIYSSQIVAEGCTMELTDGTNGLGQCISFTAANGPVQVEPCDGSASQQFSIGTA
ncbi:hypothetical protein B0H16DRAFT_1716400 [Mycena metata]|uniref:Ricin B lectin domain-containing protein n=1 Tax=Mycena metata TaxID=1033252 RepID=A0AAD7JR30_9AGAR|nr:hypothetical protein B0H16DRAFT_1716400 [Mycena metata]